MTPKQQIIWDKFKDKPEIKLIIQRLDLTPVADDKKSISIHNRINELTNLFATRLNLPAVERTVLTEATNSFFSPDRIERHLLAFYGPRPWKYPLSKAPF